MARTLKEKQPNERRSAAVAVLDHHFDIHVNCGEWCRRKSLTKEQQKATKRYYRSNSTDSSLYEHLGKVMERFITDERLEELAHGMDTNANESFNNTVSWLAPKNKVYCGTRSLWNGVCIAIGITSIGFQPFFVRLFKKLGIAMTTNILYYLQTKEKYRAARLHKLMTRQQKKQRNKRKFNKLKADTLIAKKERARRDGIYKRGYALNSEGDIIPAPAKKKRQSKKGNYQCTHPFCLQMGHATTKSKKCLANPQRLLREGLVAECAAVVALAGGSVPEAEAIPSAAGIGATNDDADDLDAHDALPLVDSDSSRDIFHEAGTWSEDEDGNVVNSEFGVL